MQKPTQVAIISTLVALAMPVKAFAYIDPGSGSYIIQVILASVMGLAFALKTYWQQFKTFLASIFAPKQSN